MTIEERMAAIQQNISIVSNIGAEFIFKVYTRLKHFGYEVTPDDDWVVGFSILKIESKIKNACNITTIPDGLTQVAVDMSCGEFLFSLQQSGKLDSSFNADAALKQVKVGDTTVELGGNGSTKSLDMLIKFLINSGDGDLVCYRKIKW